MELSLFKFVIRVLCEDTVVEEAIEGNQWSAEREEEVLRMGGWICQGSCCGA
jgi:hypothetical protein